MRKGISLIEILIVIAVIVILSSGVMLSITSMEASAQANKIINDLVNIKMAALLWYKNNADTAIINLGDKNKEQVKYNGIQGWVQKVNQNNGKGDGLGLSKYLDGGKNIILNQGTNDWIPAGTYGIFDAGNEHRTTWYAGYSFYYDESAVKEKLKSRREELRRNGINIHFTATSPCKDYSTVNNVWLKIRGDYEATE